MNCQKCGREVLDKWDYCNYCGNQLKKKQTIEMKKDNEMFKKITIWSSLSAIILLIFKYSFITLS